MENAKSIEEIEKYINENEMLLVYFGSFSCSVCVSIRPKIEKMLAKFPGIKAVSAEADSSLELSAHFNVFTVPVIILYIQGKETVREARIISIPEMEKKIQRYYDLFYNREV